MLRYETKTRPGLVALYDIRPGNGAGPYLQPRSPHGAVRGRINGYGLMVYGYSVGLGSDKTVCVSVMVMARYFELNLS